ncbi:MAG: DUF5996 family protein [Candidatus Promineifilaceae bacterium]|nr:DUF5996 family protein [Candidatus Promineifilaceae bacterium]
MSNHTIFPPLDNLEPTRQTLHLYARAIGVVPRAHAEPHPKWWHISLRVVPDGLKSTRMALPDGGTFWLKMDLTAHKSYLLTSDERVWEFDMTAGLTGTEFGDQILAAVAELGLEGDYARERFESDETRDYDPAAVADFLTALVNADRIFKEHRAKLSGDVSPVQLWPHGFDLAFEWFGTRTQTFEENGEVHEYPSQLNLGFYPGGDPYFYSNPWPFEGDQLLGKELPEGASWHTEGFEGTILPYSELQEEPDAETRLLEYARRVYELAAPTLTADD